ncbi:MAG TPA: glycerophosphodiester phosphodiesterase family protein [Pseudomonadales bacterium]
MPTTHAFLIIGHRGAAGLEPENTLRSFARAIDLGVDAIELDVYCVDDELVVIHDDTLERTTNGHGEVMASRYDALRRLDAGNGERIPTLAEVLNLAESKVVVNIELKGAGTAAPVSACIAAHPRVDTLVSSFDHGELARFRAIDARTRVAPLFHRNATQLFEVAAGLQAWSINLSERLATAERLRAIVDGGYRSLVYTVNEPALAERLKADGATGIFTDFPDRMLKLRSGAIAKSGRFVE